jgi:hypothetical protein
MGASLLRAVMLRSIIYGPVPDVSMSKEHTQLQVSGQRGRRKPDGSRRAAQRHGTDLWSVQTALFPSSWHAQHSPVDPSLVTPAVDLTTQLEDRMSRLSFLIHFINDNGVQQKVCFGLKDSGRNSFVLDVSFHLPPGKSYSSTQSSCLPHNSYGLTTTRHGMRLHQPP